MRRALALLFFDTVLLGLCYYLSFFIAAEAPGLDGYRALFTLTFPLGVGAGLGGFFLAGVFSGGGDISPAREFLNIGRGALFAAGILMAGSILLGVSGDLPRSVYFIYLALMPAAAALTRLTWRVADRVFPPEPGSGTKRGALIVGGGKTAFRLIEGVRRDSEAAFEPVHIVDDSDALQGNTMHGVKIQGTISDMPLQAWRSRAEEIVIAEDLDTEALVPVARLGLRTGLPMMLLPPAADIDHKMPLHRQLRPLSLTDLVDRGAADVSPGEIRGCISGKRVLVLGADSVIGRGICRHLGRFNPAQLLFFGTSSETLDVIDRESVRLYPVIDRKVLLGSTMSQCRVEEVMAEHSPDVVFHVAPHRSGEAAQENYRDALLANGAAVRRCAEAAAAAGSTHFVNVSSSEAGEPVNVAGLSMRIGEIALQALGGGGLETKFLSVRTGDVIDEEAGIARLWLAQAARGGPVTVSHQDAEQRFISADRAARLVLQASALARGGEIFIAGPGRLMKTVSLVRLAAVMTGLGDGKELEIRYRGLGRGERMSPGGDGKGPFSETGREGLRVSHPEAPDEEFLVVLGDLEELLRACDSPREIFSLARELVPEFRPQGRKHV